MRIIILGDGGHSKVIQDIIHATKEHQVAAILDDKYECEFIKKGVIYGPIASFVKHFVDETKVIIGIGNNKTRQKLVHLLQLHTDDYPSLIHPTAVISPTAMIQHGTVIMANTVINAEAIIGAHCIINTGSIIEHETVIGNYSHICPNATLTGNVDIGDGVMIGASTTIIQGVQVGDWSVIGAGTTVIRDIPACCKAVGSPARIIEHLYI